MSIQTPRFLDNLERRYHRFGIENLGMYLVILQAFGFLAISAAPMVAYKFVFLPELFLRGEVWRMFTFVALPPTIDFWIIFALFFLYWIMQVLEQILGTFKTTLYLFLSLAISLIYSLATSYPLATFMFTEFTLVFAVVLHAPEEEIHLFGILPVKMWMLGVFNLFLVIYYFVLFSWLGRGFILATFANYFLFFGVHHYRQITGALRRRNWRA